jgi:hypothetical protein
MITVSEDVLSKKRKPYTHLACACCKSKHIKCDGGKPSCQSCLSKKLECHYREERNMRRSTSKSQIKEEEFKDQLSQLQKEVEYWKSRYYTLIQLINGNIPPPNHDDFPYPNPNQSLPINTKVHHSHIKKSTMPQKGNHPEEFHNYKEDNLTKPITSKSTAPYYIPDRQKSYSYGDIPPLYPSDMVTSPNFVPTLQPPLLGSPIERSRSHSQYEDNMIIENNHFLSETNRSNSVPNSMPLSSSYTYSNIPLGMHQEVMGTRATSVPVLDRFDSFEDSIHIQKSDQDNGYDSSHFSLLVDSKPVYNKGTRDDNTPQNGELFKFQVNDYNMLYHSPIQGYIYRDDYQGMGYMNNPSSIH